MRLRRVPEHARRAAPGQRRPAAAARAAANLRVRRDPRLRPEDARLPRRPAARRPGRIATGDLGEIDADGYVYVRGRARNVFITSFGRNVAPEWVEREIAQRLPQRPVLVHGEARPYRGRTGRARSGTMRQAAVVERAIADANAALPDYAQRAALGARAGTFLLLERPADVERPPASQRDPGATPSRCSTRSTPDGVRPDPGNRMSFYDRLAPTHRRRPRLPARGARDPALPARRRHARPVPGIPDAGVSPRAPHGAAADGGRCATARPARRPARRDPALPRGGDGPRAVDPERHRARGRRSRGRGRLAAGHRDGRNGRLRVRHGDAPQSRRLLRHGVSCSKAPASRWRCEPPTASSRRCSLPGEALSATCAATARSTRSTCSTSPASSRASTAPDDRDAVVRCARAMFWLYGNVFRGLDAGPQRHDAFEEVRMKPATAKVLITGGAGGIGGAIASRTAVARRLGAARRPRRRGAGAPRRTPCAATAIASAPAPPTSRRRRTASCICETAAELARRRQRAGQQRGHQSLPDVRGPAADAGRPRRSRSTCSRRCTCAAACCAHLRAQPEARILNIGSVFGSIGYPGYAVYSATKFAMRGFTEALRRELSDTRIKVHYCAPRATRTGINTSRGRADERRTRRDDGSAGTRRTRGLRHAGARQRSRPCSAGPRNCSRGSTACCRVSSTARSASNCPSSAAMRPSRSRRGPDPEESP